MLGLSVGLPLALVGCAGNDQPTTLPPLVTGYRHLTPLRLNVLDVDVEAAPAPGTTPQDPAAEMRRMAQERLVPVGTRGMARFRIGTARFLREPLPASGGLTGLFAGEPGERISVDMLCRLEILSPEGARVGFVEAVARRSMTLPDGTAQAARSRAAAEVLRQGMEELNVEFEFQIRRALRDWLVEGTPSLTPAPVEREDLPGASPRS
jgi:hypothetical protein